MHVPQAAPVIPRLIADARVARLFGALSARDRVHLVAAFRTAKEAPSDEELLLAVLLHDIGKSTLSGQRISLGARVFAVLEQHLPDRARKWIHSDRDGAWLTGPWLAEHHAGLGAARLRALGLPADVCRLVELHDRPDVADDRLRLLRDIDSSTV